MNYIRFCLFIKNIIECFFFVLWFVIRLLIVKFFEKYKIKRIMFLFYYLKKNIFVDLFLNLDISILFNYLNYIFLKVVIF